MNLVDKLKVRSVQGLRLARSASEFSGELLAKITKAEQHAEAYKDDVINVEDVQSFANFRQQLPDLSKKLLGNRLAKIASLTNKFLPESLVESISDQALMKIGTLAEQWSRVDIPGEYRFSEVTQMSETQRAQLSHQIANQNRSLAALGGGVTGLTGIWGILADSAWLLLVALRLVFQTAAAHNYPLTGREGVKIAFTVLGYADLSQINQKQTLLLTMGSVKELIELSDISQVSGLFGAESSVGYYVKSIKDIVEMLDIDIDIDFEKTGLNFLARFLPFTASITSGVFNIYIINEVAAAADAAFSPKESIEHKRLSHQDTETQDTETDEGSV